MLILCIYTNYTIYQCDKSMLLSKITRMILLVYRITEDNQQFQSKLDLSLIAQDSFIKSCDE